MGLSLANRGLYPLSGKTSHSQISLSPEAVRLCVRMISFALQFDRFHVFAAAEGPVKFQSDWRSLNPNLADSKLHEILRKDVLPLSD